ncbi:MAG: hypothetical protein SGPRY_006351 [Prymnesium sp.]
MARERRASSSRAHMAWRAPPPASPPQRGSLELDQSKAATRARGLAASTDRVGPKGYTSVRVLRALRLKYSSEQLGWCRRRLPEAMQLLGWVVLPEDARGTNMSSYGECHYMYAFVGKGISKVGKKVPFFGSKERAIEWYEQWLLEVAHREPLFADVDYNSSSLAVRAQGLRLWHRHDRRRGLTYRGVTSKLVSCDGQSALVHVAKDEREYLGTFAHAVDAAVAYAKHLASNGVVLGESESQTKDPLEVRREEAHFVGLLPIPDLLACENERARESDRARPAASQCNRTKEDPPKRTRPPPAHIAKDKARKAEQLYKRVCKSIQSSNEIISCTIDEEERGIACSLETAVLPHNAVEAAVIAEADSEPESVD